MQSVLQDWVMELPLRQQGVLILALRGPDGARKEDVAKPVIRTLRGLSMVSGREGTAMHLGTHWRDDTFMNTRHIANDEEWCLVRDAFFSSVDQFNIHFYQHLMHAFAVVGINHPDPGVREKCWAFYQLCCHKLHVGPETQLEFAWRLRTGRREDQDE